MSKIILKIWYSCNHRCDFCHAEFNKSITNKETLKTITNPYGDGKACERIVNFIKEIK